MDLPQLRGQKIERVERAKDQVNIHVEGSAPINITFNEYRVLADPEVRKGLQSVVHPITRDGVDAVVFQSEDRPPKRIIKSEAKFFDTPPLPEEEVSVDVQTGVVEVVSPVFRDKSKWVFSQGAGRFWADIADEKFLTDVEKHRIQFGRGDALRV